MTIQNVITHVQSVLPGAVSAIKYAPEYPVDTSTSVITALTYANNISLELQGGFVLTFFDLTIDVLMPRVSINDNMQVLSGIPEAVFAVFSADPTIGGHAQTFSSIMTANLINVSVNAVEMIGYRMVVGRVKL